MLCPFGERLAGVFYRLNNMALPAGNTMKHNCDDNTSDLRAFINTVLEHRSHLTFDFDNEISDATLSEYCQSIITDILSSEDLTNVDFQLLVQLAYRNPFVIEKRIPDIFKRVLQQEHTPEYIDLLVAILDASIRLRREEKLVSQILICTRQLSNETPRTESSEFLPQKFKDKFTQSVNNITNSQAISILRSLIFHLNTDCMEMLQPNNSCKNIALMKVTIELLVALLDGICIFENTGTLLSHQKFTHELTELGNVLSRLVDKALHLKHNKEVIVKLLTAITSWNEAQYMLKYYMPKAGNEEFVFPISDDSWNQLIQRITNFGQGDCKNYMNNLILRHLNVVEETTNKPCTKLKELIGGLEYSWRSVLKYNAQIVPCLANKELIKLTSLLVNDMMLSSESFDEWATILKKDCLQESKNLVLSLISSVLARIGDLIPAGVTKSLIDFIGTKDILETDDDENTKVKNILKLMKEELKQNQWTEMEYAVSEKMEGLLKILLQTPLIFLNYDIRTMIFIIVFSISRECSQNKEVATLSNEIFSDLLEKPGVAVLQYIDLQSIIDGLPHNKIFQKALENSWRNGFSKKMSKNLVKLSLCNSETMYLILQSMENVKGRLATGQKVLLKKSEEKLVEAMLTTSIMDTVDVKTVKALTLMIRASLSNGNVDENLVNIATTTLGNIFTTNVVSSQTDDLLKVALQLARVVVQNRQTFPITDNIVQSIWHTMLKHPCTDILLPLLEMNGPKEFQYLTEMMHKQLVKELADDRPDSLENIFYVWHAILKTSMSADRNKVRLTAVSKLLQTVQVTRISEKCWPSIMKLMQNILSVKHLHLPGNIIDMSIVLALRAIDEVQIVACNDAIILYGILIKVRTNLITDRLPILLLLYRRLVSTVVHSSKTITDKIEEHTLRCMAVDIEKCTSSLIKLKKDMVRLSPYVIADLLEVFSETSIAGFVKTSVQNCIGQLISICDQHGIALLSRTLPVSMQEILKAQLDQFNKFYKFSGKI